MINLYVETLERWVHTNKNNLLKSLWLLLPSKTSLNHPWTIKYYLKENPHLVVIMLSVQASIDILSITTLIILTTTFPTHQTSRMES